MINKVLVDGDMYVYRNGFAAEEKGVPVVSQKIVQGRLSTSLMHLVNLFTGEKTPHIKIFLSGQGNFRFGLDPNYKIRRKQTVKPVYYQELREFLIKVWGAKIINGAEADDALGVEAFENFYYVPIDIHGWFEDSDACIVSNDKDLNMIPGWHYNPVKREKYFISEYDGLRNFYKQLLTGDKADDIMGLGGIGPVKAERYLSQCATESHLYRTVLGFYKGDEERLKRTGQLLWISRNQLGELWQIPQI